MTLKLAEPKGGAAEAALGICKGRICSNTPCYTGGFTELQRQRAGHGNVCTAAPFFPGQTTPPASALYPPALAKPRKGRAGCSPSSPVSTTELSREWDFIYLPSHSGKRDFRAT